MEKRMLFLDLDGTLLSDDKLITPGNRRALEGALRRGHGVIITTGRPLKSAIDQARCLGLDKPGCYLIAFNGAAVYDWEKRALIFSRTLELDTAAQVFALANARKLHVQAYDSQNVLVEKRCDDEEVRWYSAMTHMDFRVIEDVPQGLRETPAKILVIELTDSQRLEQLQQALRQALEGRVDCFFSSGQLLEVVPAGLNKGEAVKMLCRLLDVPIENAVAVGDAANDLSMLRAAGIGVAMANGTAEVKAAADYITQRDNNHDGVAEVVEKFLQ